MKMISVYGMMVNSSVTGQSLLSRGSFYDTLGKNVMIFPVVVLTIVFRQDRTENKDEVSSDDDVKEDNYHYNGEPL